MFLLELDLGFHYVEEATLHESIQIMCPIVIR